MLYLGGFGLPEIAESVQIPTQSFKLEVRRSARD
jgi:hypothetical protein